MTARFLAFVAVICMAFYLTALFACVVWEAPAGMITVISLSPAVLVATRVRSVVLVLSFSMWTISLGVVAVWAASMFARLPVGTLGYLWDGNLDVHIYRKGPLVWKPQRTGLLGITYGESPAKDRAGNPFTVKSWTVPLGPILLCSLLLATAFLLVWLVGRLFVAKRQLSRLREGQCLVCGYDLRGSEKRCPECGTQFDKSRIGIAARTE